MQKRGLDKSYQMKCDIPEGFFEDITERTLSEIERLTEAPQLKGTKEYKSRTLYYGIAAAVACLIGVGALFLTHSEPREIPETEALSLVDDYLETMSDEELETLILMIK